MACKSILDSTLFIIVITDGLKNVLELLKLTLVNQVCSSFPLCRQGFFIENCNKR